MRKLLSSPVKMSLSAIENQVYQNALKHIPALTLNLLAIKVDNHPEDFCTWCQELSRLINEKLNVALLEPEQLPVISKLQTCLEAGVSISQLKMLRIAPWPIFAGFINQQAEIHALTERLALMDYLSSINEQPLAEMIVEDRLAFAGKHTAKHDIAVYKFDVEWFASTKGAKVFHQLLELHPSAFDQALALIPSTGEVEFTHYQAFVEAYKAIFSTYAAGENAPLMPATRLLAMRRPDQFIAINNAKVDVYCQGFAITKLNNRDFNGYWHELIGTLRTMAWWYQEAPAEESEVKLWQNRAILVDLFLFADENSANKSNYIKLRDKPKKVKAANGLTPSIKRTKESAESLVDKALSMDGLPEYLLNKRDSIVHQVKNGKSVDHVITMMRAIFG
jgi:hypothetical protein